MSGSGADPIEILHDAVPGRLRVRLAGLRCQDDRARRLERALLRHGGILRARANPVTGTLLIVHDGIGDQRALRQRIDDAWAIACGAAAPDEPDWWRESPAETAARLGVALTGLTDEQAAERRRHYGPNRLVAAEPPGAFRLLLRQLNSLPVLLLAGSGLASLLTGGVIDALLIGGVVAGNAAIGFVTEQRAARIIEGFVSHAHATALVRRGGTAREIPAEEVVPGDLLVLLPGAAVPADARVVEAHDLAVDESMLTGESLSVPKAVEALPDHDVPLAERRNLVFGGTLIVGGHGLALVVAVGRATEMGQINAVIAETARRSTPLQRRLAQLELRLTGVSGIAALVMVALGLLTGQGLVAMLPTAIALAVAAIPEGLPTTATAILARGLGEMQRQGVLIRSLDAVETLGSVNAVCFDKTGTLTQNRMAAALVAFNGDRLSIRDGRFWRGEAEVDPASAPPLLMLLRVAVLCNESEVHSGAQAHIANGSSTENALLLAAIEAGLSIEQVRADYPMIEVERRAEQRRYMVTRHATPHGVFVAAKGNPADILDLCGARAGDDETLPLDPEHRRAIRAVNDEMAARGLRVLGFAYKPEQDAAGGLIWLGMIGLSDPLRPDMSSVIADFHRAGIRTVMITGDQAATARAIAEDLRLAPDIRVADSVSAMRPAQFDAAAQRADVFARISPVDKLRIVQALQEGGHIVAMTGDGTNDAPALRAADVGVALGGNGSAIARETADVVLANDDLATMVVAVRQGRSIYANMRKAVHFLIGTNSSEILLALTATALGLGAPLSPAQLLWINLLSDVAIAVSLGFEPPETDLMAQPPRPADEPILKLRDYERLLLKGGLFSASALGGHLYGLARHGAGGGGIAFVTLLLTQLLDGLSSRSETQPVWRLPRNPILTASLLGLAGLQAGVMLVPAARRILGIAALGWLDLAVIGAGSIAPFAGIELAKAAGSPRVEVEVRRPALTGPHVPALA